MTEGWLDKLVKVTKAKDKEKILEQAWREGETRLFEGIKLSLDPYTNYHLTKTALITEEDEFEDEIDWSTFVLKLKLISDRVLEDEKLQEQIHNWCDTSSVKMWNEFYRRILLKNWDQDISIILFNRVMKRLEKKDIKAKKFMCPEIGYQKVNPVKEIIGGIHYLDPWYSGKRTLFIALSSQRSLRLYERDHFIDHDFGSEFVEKLPVDVVIDTVYSKGTYWAIDIAPVTEFATGRVDRTQRERHEALCELDELLHESFQGKVKILPKLEINLNENNGLKDALTEFKQQGFGHVVIKNADGIYQHGKNPDWYKLST